MPERWGPQAARLARWIKFERVAGSFHWTTMSTSRTLQPYDRIRDCHEHRLGQFEEGTYHSSGVRAYEDADSSITELFHGLGAVLVGKVGIERADDMVSAPSEGRQSGEAHGQVLDNLSANMDVVSVEIVELGALAPVPLTASSPYLHARTHAVHPTSAPMR